MRTALVLLFLLALASIPGALLPQRSLNAPKVAAYLAARPTIGPVMDRVGLFDVFSSPTFAAIYGLLFVSLIGCLLPRTWEQARTLRSRPVAVPRNLSRLPHHHVTTTAADTTEAVAVAERRLRRWRTTRHTGSSDQRGEVTMSAERGYLREVGNLVFHFSLVGLLAAVLIGKLVGYEGQLIVLADGGPGFCNTSPAAYDSFRAGLTGDGVGLEPFCVKVDQFTADYLPTGQAEAFLADIEYQAGPDLQSNTWRPYDLRVNDPLRLSGDRVYLLGHGYAPQFTVTFPDGESRTEALQFKPVDLTTLLSDGAMKFDPPAGLYPDPEQRRRNQVALSGLLAPTAAFTGTLLSSGFPAARDPAVAIDVYQGDTGLDSGASQSIFALDTTLVDEGRLIKQARVNLRPGQATTLPDGTTVRFDTVIPWVSLQTSHDPAQGAVLVFALTMTAGLMASLLVKRRRVWVRFTPHVDGTRVEIGGLARTDQAGWGEEFTELTAELVTDQAGTPLSDSRGSAPPRDQLSGPLPRSR
ncbi:cytochrome c biogenesis protein ResB [Rhodococcus aerolatus]